MSSLPAVAGRRPRFEVADVFRIYGERYRRSRRPPRPHLKVMHDIEVCRTGSLGGHLEKCDACGYEHPAYNSCRNRHCPKCQSLAKARWLDERRRELLPVGYFHNVFTLPHELNPMALCNKRIVLDILFQSATATLKEFASDQGGKLGLMAILHTWDQRMLDHFHLHCLIAGGVLSADGEKWIHARHNFLFPVKALSKVFRGKFTAALEKAYAARTLQFPGKTAPLGSPERFADLLKGLRRKPWVVYSRKPFAGPETVLDYLGRYTHRVAISNHRIKKLTDGKVTLTYRDRRDGNRTKTMTLRAHEFIRRFLLHVLPERFMRIRHYGFLSNSSKGSDLQRVRHLLGLPEPSEPEKKTVCQLMLELTGVDVSLCPRCKRGTMRLVKDIEPRTPYHPQTGHPWPEILDTS